MAALRGFGATACDLGAAAQQLLLVGCLSRNSRDYAERLLAGDVVIREWRHQRDTIEPSWMLLEGPYRHLWLIMEGSTNLAQFGMHASAFRGTKAPWGKGVMHPKWLSIWQGISTEVRRIISGDPSAPAMVRLSGHSYGGALAVIGGIEWAAQLGTGAVQVITFGAPKACGRWYTGPIPDACWRVESEHDVVTSLPPRGIIEHAPYIVPAKIVRYGQEFAHVGQSVELGPEGLR